METTQPYFSVKHPSDIISSCSIHVKSDMKRISQILLITGLLLGCSKKDSNSIIRLGGIYTGCFEYRGTTYWCSISFEDYNYIEWPSGGIYYQKPLECLTVGTYTLDETTFTFNLDSFK
jgi:hypothetical protein